jgi:hypothetical protein
LLQRLLKELERAPRGAEHGGATDARRDDTLARMKRLQRDGLRDRGKGFRQTRAAVVAAAALAFVGVLLVGLVGLARFVGVAEVEKRTAGQAQAASQVRLRVIAGLVEVSRGGRRDIVGADTRLLLADDRVETRAGAVASLFLPSGATFSVGERASLQVSVAPERAAAHEEVQLALGRIDVHVPKLVEQGSSFVVRSADTTVTVHGTRFSVVVEETPVSRLVTRVEVTEGVVAVASRGKTVELRSGDRWSSGPVESAAGPGASGDARDVAPRAPEPSSVQPRDEGSPNGPGGAAGRLRSTLGSENELLSQAMAASAAGDDAAALTLLGAFLSKHPGSPLAENAAVERLRLLSRTGNRAGAARAARGYLARYPEGIGRDLARRLATDGTGEPTNPKSR